MLCKNSWIDMTWDGKPARTSRENLKVTINLRAKTLVDFDQACDQVAVEIYDRYKNLYLAFSGGSDSEYVATVLARNKIPFTPLIIDFVNIKAMDQKYEQWYALQWCRKYQINPKIIELDDYKLSNNEKQVYDKLKPRLHRGSPTVGCMYNTVKELGGHLITGAQLEYYPDHEQMNYLEPQLGNYHGFVMEETDLYIETLEQNQHPWAFYYWSPEVMAAFVHKWDCDMTMQENKSAIYKTSPRPKFVYPNDFVTDLRRYSRDALTKAKWGTRDCALMGSKEHLLSQLLE
jgi:hypothetical protein